MAKRSKYRDSARGQECQVRLPGICSGNDEETILAHLNGGGMGMKKNDIHASFCCASCHNVLDGRVPTMYDRDTLELAHRQGVERTQDIWIKSGLLNV